jgi:hypothetical protein
MSSCCCFFLPASRPERSGFRSVENRTDRHTWMGAADPKRLLRMLYDILFWPKLSIKAAYIGGCWCRELLRVFFSPNWGISNLEGISQNRKMLFMLKAKKELYKTDKERTQVNRLLDIDSHPWCFVSVLKSSFEACCVHWTLLMLSFELVSQTRKISPPAWRFSNLEKRTTSVERSRLILVDYLPDGEHTLPLDIEGSHRLEEIHSYTFSR